MFAIVRATGMSVHRLHGFHRRETSGSSRHCRNDSRCNLWTFVFLLAAALAPAAGCQSQSASLELITVARRGLAMAQEAEAALHARQVKQLEVQAASLDAAFDADVKLLAAGQVRDAQGKPLSLTPEWVISARKGYAAARDVVGRQARDGDSAHATRVDNLQASDEALEMASQIILQQMALGQTIRQQLLEAQRKLAASGK